MSDRARIGPFARLRPGSEIGQDAHVGNFVETKKAKLGKGAKANHLTYLGDAEVGAGSNIGAGVITCNYDGVHKYVTRIGQGAFVGSDSTLVAPVEIGDGAYIGAGSCITRGRSLWRSGSGTVAPGDKGGLGGGSSRCKGGAEIGNSADRTEFDLARLCLAKRTDKFSQKSLTL